MLKSLRVLMVEDSEDDAELVLRFVKRSAEKIHCRRVTTEQDMRQALQSEEWNIVISDFNLPSFSGSDAIQVLKTSGVDIPLILVSGTIGEDTAVDALKQGASDYVLKSNLGRLSTSIDYALRAKATAQEKRQLVKQLEQAQKMEAVGRLAGGLAHDVNNVLAAITLYAELTLEQIGRNELEKATQNLKGILSAQQSAAGIIQQLLLFGRRKYGPTKVLDFASVVRGVEPLLKRLIGEDIELTIRASGQQPLPVSADPVQIEQVVMNLAVNARDAMPSGGALEFSLESRQLDVVPADVRIPTPPGPYVVLTARDTGCGMSAETLQRIFEPFFTTKEVGKGTGLGLSVIYGILQQAKGTLSVESVPGTGTSFKIFWPVSTPAPQIESITPKPKEEKKSPSATAIQILLTEDEPLLRLPLAITLRNGSFTVHEATQGAEALQILTERLADIDLLITDVVMPKMGGFELAKKARELNPDLPILFLSGYADGALQEQQMDLSSIWFLQKPFPTRALLEKINEILSERNSPAHDKTQF